ncbi:MAG: DUF697 domain-containing protein [Alphaproteobacteria bacterium]|nr:DUF697 domain-containing protein [Alphaproteobacteria bacterium]MBM3652965.1 DUF697 domain-containing protein [Alphaproteobacteria bacterium]
MKAGSRQTGAQRAMGRRELPAYRIRLASCRRRHDEGSSMTEEAVATIDTPKIEQAHEILKRNMLWSAGAGLVPVPLVELVAITAVELKLVKELAELYETPFQHDLAKSAIVSLIGGLGAVSIGRMLAYGSLRFIPLIGLPMAVASVSATAAGVTYAIGKVFTAHFETGGTLLDFDAEKMRKHFQEEFAKGVKEAAQKTAAQASSLSGLKA